MKYAQYMQYRTFCDNDPDPMLDIEAVEQEQLAAADLHNGYLCTVELS